MVYIFGMKTKTGTKGAITRDNILTKAALLFQQQGYAATSISQIIEASEQPKGSLYFHFPGGKQEIAIVAAVQSSAFIVGLIEEIFNSSANANEAITAVCTGFSSQLAASDYRNGCPISPMATSGEKDVDALRKSCADAYNSWLAAIEVGLKRFGINNAQCAPLASLVLSSVEGAILLSQARKNIEALDALPRSLAPLFATTGKSNDG